jgi:hypothetical protein
MRTAFYRRSAGAPGLRMPYIFALLVALNLSLFTPISCVVDCMLWHRPIAPTAGSRLICEMAQALPGIGAVADGLTAIPAPQAIYELLSLPFSLLIIAGALSAAVEIRAILPPRRPSGAPPTPPPRLALD